MTIAYSIIQKIQLEGGKRLDAEYYQPEYLRWFNQLSKSQPQTLVSLTEKIDVGFVSSMKMEFKENGIPLLRTQNVREFYIDLSTDLAHIEPTFHKKLKKSRIMPDYVLLARSGTIGDACVVPQDIGEANSADIILIKPKDVLFAEYLAAFLNCQYGRFQIERASSGGLQGHMNLFSLEKLLLPVFNRVFQNEVRDIVNLGLSSFQHSQSLYSQAESLLLEELGLSGFRQDDEPWNVVNFSEIKNTNRMDAEYFQPKYEKLEKAIKKYGAKKLENCIENVPAKFDAAKEPKRMFKYVELSNVNTSIGIIDGFSEVAGKEAPSRAKRVLKTDDVIVSSVEGSLEKAALVGKEQNDYLASTGFFQFRSREILPEVLLVMSKTPVLQMQLEKRAAGTILTAVPKEGINDILIPMLPKATQQKIANLVRQSHEARAKAKELLEEAKRKVEEMIENQ